MNLKEIRNSRWFKVGTNIYLLISVFFIVWMLFFDTNSFRILWSLESKIDDLEQQKKELIRQIDEDRLMIQKLSDSIELEKFGRTLGIELDRRLSKTALVKQLEEATGG